MQPRKVSVEPSSKPQPKPRTWLKSMRIKELEVIRFRDTHLEEAQAAKCLGKSFVPKEDYCPACTSRDRKYPSNFPRCQDWEDFWSEFSDWDADLKQQDRQKSSKVETPLRKPKILFIALIFQTRKHPAGWPKGLKKHVK